jgi:hypothetical protein
MKTILMTDRPPLTIDEEEWEQIGIFQILNKTGINCIETITLFVDSCDFVDNTVVIHGSKVIQDANMSILHSISCGYIVTNDEIAATARKMSQYMGFNSHYVDALIQSLPAEEFETPKSHVKDSECLIIDFDGSLKIPAKRLIFVKIEDNPNTTKITGEQWLQMNESNRREFTIEDLGQALHDSIEHSYERIKVY